MEETAHENNFRGQCIFLVFVLGSLIGIITSIGSDLWGILFFLIFFMLLVSIGIKSHNKRFLNILLFAFFIRIFLSVLHTYGLWLPDSVGDAVVFEYQGWLFSHNFSIHTFLGLQISELYVKMIALVYFFIGRVPLVIRLINAFLGSLIVANIYYITIRLYGGKKIANVSTFIAALFPTLILYSAISMREVSAIFFVSLSALFLLKEMNKKGFGSLFWSLAFFLIAILLHGAMALMLPVYIIFLLYLFFKERDHRVLALVIIILSVFVFWRGYPLLMRKVPIISVLFNGGDFLSKVTSVASRGGAAYLKNFSNVNGIFDIVWKTPIRMIYFLFAPFPWMFHKLIDLFGFLDSVCYMLIAFFSLSGIKKLWKEKRIVAVIFLFSFLTMWIGFSWGTSNFGTAIRHRTFLVWILIPLAAFGVWQRKKLFSFKSKNGIDTVQVLKKNG